MGRNRSCHSRAIGALILAGAFVTSGCGASGNSSGSTQTGGNAGTGGASTSSPVVRLGCHQYCQSAGGYGAGGPVKPPAAKVLSPGTITVLPGGIVPVTVRCLLSKPCLGAIVLDSDPACSNLAESGRSDLAVEGQSTRTIGVPLSSCQGSLLRERGQLEAGIIVDSHGGRGPVCGQYECLAGRMVVLRSAG